MRVLYLAYEGFSEQLGQSQILPYVKKLAEKGHQMEVIGFEKPGVPLCYRSEIYPNVRWTALRYHKYPTVPATLYDMMGGFFVSALRNLLGQVDLVHVRSAVPFAMVLPWLMISRTPCLFHTEGFWFDEKVDSGVWTKNGKLWKIGKKLEQVMYRRANAVSMLTHSSKDYLENEYEYREKIKSPISVITVCTDLKRFSMTSEPFEIGSLIYVGSLGGWYMANEMVEFYAAWRKYARNPKFILATKSPVEVIKKEFVKIGAEKELVHLSVEHHEVPKLIQKAQAAVCFIQPYFSKRGSMPTKLGEYLASGVPVAANIIGDMDKVLKNSQAGVVLSNFSDSFLKIAAKNLYERSLNPEVRKEARALAEKWFDLDQAVDAYDGIYRRLVHGL